MPKTENAAPGTTTFNELLRPLEGAFADIESNRTVHQ